tara:strand:+ start:57 stop:608 length:552 start_codon:yes stop_codon:yes gene_type:complete
MAHAKPIQTGNPFAWVFGKPLSKHPSEYLDTFVVIRKNMSEAVMSPDGKFMWTGSEWIPSPPSEVVEASSEVQNSSEKKDWKREEKIESLLKISDMQADIDEIEERVAKFNPILTFTLVITISLFAISLLGFDELSRAAGEMAICGFFIWLLLAGFVEYTMTNKMKSLNKKIRFERKWHRDKS